ncbi:MAG: Error-prone repair protein ImuA [Flavobacterium sp.]|nr:MAG: Error-prone repair protein ImuA [Flavobacterium sp.]
MQSVIEKREIARQLQAKINAMQGLGKPVLGLESKRFAPFSSAFPDGIFPAASLHEFISYEPADAASTTGFITALAGKFMKEGGLCLWIGNEQKIFPAGLKHFGLEPDRIVFINTPKLHDVMWIIEEALKCEALTAVMAEVKQLGFTESRRLQLAVENSGVTGFIHRFQPYGENATACTARWKITSLPSRIDQDVPGVGHSSWDVQLVKVRNGRPDSWQVTWSDGQFVPIHQKQFSILQTRERHAG